MLGVEETLHLSVRYISNLFHNMAQKYKKILDALDDAVTAKQVGKALVDLLDKKLSEGELKSTDDRDKVARLRGRVMIHLNE